MKLYRAMGSICRAGMPAASRHTVRLLALLIAALGPLAVNANEVGAAESVGAAAEPSAVHPVVTRGERALVAVLSLQPMPVDLGNIYIGRWRLGLASTAVQVGLMIGMAAFMSSNGLPMHHRDASEPDEDWTRRERVATWSLVGGYVATKFVSAGVALGALERDHARRQVVFAPQLGLDVAGGALIWRF